MYNSIDPKLIKLLLPLVGSEELAERWWNGANKAFELKTPLEAYNQDPSAVLAYLQKYLEV